MTELEKTKYQAIETLQDLCARCKERVEHHMCPVNKVIQEIQTIRGVPVIVNNRLRHVVFS